jgi:hypothetical protein
MPVEVGNYVFEKPAGILCSEHLCVTTLQKWCKFLRKYEGGLGGKDGHHVDHGCKGLDDEFGT